MGNDITNKRKRKSTADVSSALAALKKSKSKSKSQDPPPKKARKEESSEDEQEENEEEVEKDVEEDEEDEVEQTNGHADDDDQDEEANGQDLPTDSTPVLPLGTNAESFEELKLSDKTMEAIKEMGFTKMTAIQKTVRIRRLPALSPATANLTFLRPFLLCSLARTSSVPPRPVQERLLPS